MPQQTQDDTLDRLIDSIGYYALDPTSESSRDEQRAKDRKFVADRLSVEGYMTLCSGSFHYNIQYEQKVREFAGNDVFSSEQNRLALNNRQYFRQQFIRHVINIKNTTQPRFTGNEPNRGTHPERFTVKAETLLGTEGLELYKLALEEEVRSGEYMDALFRYSTRHFDGEKWAVRPVVVVAGPSGCGKSWAAQKAVEKADAFLPKIDGDNSGNDVVRVDGGEVRMASQMRKLLISLADNKKYSGVSDLHEQSAILEDAKDNILEAAIASPSLGVVIPETFSDFINPLGHSRRLLNRIIQLEDTKPVFCRVDGQNPSIFQKIVAYMGSRRAWKTRGFDEQAPLDLNNTNIAESKAYGKRGFIFGQRGSKLAEKWFINKCKSLNKENLSMIITNDLVLKKPTDNNQWVDAEQGDEGAILVSKRVFAQWESLQLNLQDVPENQRPDIPSLKDFADRLQVPPIIHTSAGIDIAIARESIRKRMLDVAKELRKTTNVRKAARLAEKRERLEQINNILNKLTDVTPKQYIESVKNDLVRRKVEMKHSGQFSRFFSKTKSSVNQVIEALDKLYETAPNQTEPPAPHAL